jgi:hypothetical protein
VILIGDAVKDPLVSDTLRKVVEEAVADGGPVADVWLVEKPPNPVYAAAMGLARESMKEIESRCRSRRCGDELWHQS